jgi:Carboxypeptidase regulatory-like domain/CarboxypepD_reg-like domain
VKKILSILQLVLCVALLAPSAALAAEAYGGISGTVTDAADDEPLANVSVCAEEVDGIAFFQGCAETGADGAYAIEELHQGEYVVHFRATPRNYVPLTVHDVEVESGATTPDVDAALEEGAELEGTVTEAVGGEPLEGIYACAEPEDGGGSLPCAQTDAAGKYLIVGLRETSYRVSFIDNSSARIYARQYYDGEGSSADATMVPLTLGTKTTGIDAALVEAGKIAGTVTSAAAGAPLEGIGVCASEVEPISGSTRCAQTDPAGNYTITGLGDGTHYSVHFYGGLDYLSQYYDGKATFQESDYVTTENTVVTGGIDAQLQPAGRIEGHVTAADSGEPFDQGQVCVVKTTAQSFSFPEQTCATVDAAGDYVIGALESGSYDVRFSAPNGDFIPDQQNYLTQYFDGARSRSAATPLQVTAGSAATGIDAAMQPGGKVTGTVTDTETGLPVHAYVCALPTVHRGGDERCAYSDGSGDYAVRGLHDGSYKVRFFPVAPDEDHVFEFFDDKPSKREADPVSVTEGEATSGIDAALSPGGKISGTVTDAQTHEPIGGVEVCTVNHSRCDGTNDEGEYTIVGIPSGSYKLVFREWGNPNRHVTAYYHDKPSAAEAQPVAVSAGQTTAGIDQEMQPGGRISGTVFEEQTSTRIGGIQACGTALDGSESRCTTTESYGTYTLAGLPAGDYQVRFSHPEGWTSGGPARWMQQYYDEADTAAEADPVQVNLGATTAGIDAHLREGGRIEGQVTAAATGKPVAGVGVCLQPVDPEAEAGGGCGFTGSDGNYTLEGVAAGEYLVAFLPGFMAPGPIPNLSRRFYDEAERRADATPITVAEGTAYPGIDAQLVVGGRISGRITEAGSGEPLEGVTVCAYEAGNEGAVECASSNAHGEYTIARLPTGSYKVEFSARYYEFEEGIGGEGEGGEPAVEEEFATQFYNGAPSLAAATSVPVTAGQIADGIDAQMSKPVPPPPGPPPAPPQEAGQSQTGASSPGLGAGPPPSLRPPVKPKPRCRKGFKRKTVHGKRRCVKVHRHHGKHHRKGR